LSLAHGKISVYLWPFETPKMAWPAEPLLRKKGDYGAWSIGRPSGTCLP